MTFALLLFLVCALLASIVLAAATGAAGRSTHRMAEADKHYYSAVSAAELLKDQIEGEKVTLEFAKANEGNTIKVDNVLMVDKNASANKNLIEYVEDNNLHLNHGEYTALSFMYLLANSSSGDSPITSITLPTSSSDAESYTFGSVWEALGKYYENASSFTRNAYVSSEYTLSEKNRTLGGSDQDAIDDSLKVTVKQETYLDGSFVITVTSGESVDTQYTIQLLCDADVDITDITQGEVSGQKKIATMQWRVTQLDKSVA